MRNLALLYIVHYDCKILYNNKRLFNSSKSAFWNHIKWGPIVNENITPLLVSVELFKNDVI